MQAPVLVMSKFHTEILELKKFEASLKYRKLKSALQTPRVVIDKLEEKHNFQISQRPRRKLAPRPLIATSGETKRSIV
jgi:hypothetical protein